MDAASRGATIMATAPELLATVAPWPLLCADDGGVDAGGGASFGGADAAAEVGVAGSVPMIGVGLALVPPGVDGRWLGEDAFGAAPPAPSPVTANECSVASALAKRSVASCFALA